MVEPTSIWLPAISPWNKVRCFQPMTLNDSSDSFTNANLCIFVFDRSNQLNDSYWIMQSVDWLGDLQRIAAHRLGGLVDDMSNISDCLVGNDNERAHEPRTISPFSSGWWKEPVQSWPNQEFGRFL